MKRGEDKELREVRIRNEESREEGMKCAEDKE
jgi:hypothetical protein